MRLFFLLTALLGFVEGPDPGLVSDDLKQEERLGGTFDPFEDAEAEHGTNDRERAQYPLVQLSKSTDGGRKMDQPVVVWTAARHSDVI